MSKASILIVEDEGIVAMDILFSLKNLGYTIAGHTERAEDVLKKATELRPDLVLMDIGLKGSMDGIEAAKQIRERLGLPVVFLTAYANQSTIERAREAQQYGYILKPFDEDELTATIEAAIHRHRLEHGTSGG